MNFLAHLHLAEATPESRLGNLLGDFVKGLPWDDRYSDEIWQGIMEHRYLDAFTDNHEAWKRSRNRLQAENRRYAGIVIDVFYDFFLHKYWETFNPDQSVNEFVGDVHRDLNSIRKQGPREMNGVLSRMIRQNWLLSYGQIKGVEKTLQRVAGSSPNLSAIKGMEVELLNEMGGFEEDFLNFYPDAIQEVIVIRKKVIPNRKNRNKNPDSRYTLTLDNEETLVKNVQSGDLASFERLIDAHSSHLRAFVAMKLPVPHLIDEIAHEAFVFAHRHIDDFEAGTDFGKWLRAIAFNLIRKETLRFQRTAKNQEKFLDHCLIQSSTNEGFGPESSVVAYLEECLNELPEHQTVLLERKYSLAESSREMAEALGKSEAWVRTTLCRVRTALRGCIEDKAAASGI